jgi:secreted PhoX family phosphatase
VIARRIRAIPTLRVCPSQFKLASKDIDVDRNAGSNERAEAKGNIKGDAFGSPDGLWTDARGVLWIQTDVSTSAIGKGDYAKLGNNQMLAADPKTGEIRRFLVGPVGQEITGATATPDGRTMFINVQHPGESPSERGDPDNPDRFSNWPSGQKGMRPRSATVVIRKNDGGLIGT